MNVSPVIRIRGTVYAVALRTVAAQEAKPAERDPETGRIVRDAFEAREEYDVLDFTVHTDDGGYALVLMRGDVLEQALGGAVPNKGAAVDWPARNFITWRGRAGSKYPTVGYSVAGDVLAAETAKPGARAATLANAS